MTTKYDRRAFIAFLGKAGLGTLVIPPFLISCGNTATPSDTAPAAEDVIERLKKLTLEGMAASDKDDLLLAKGLDYHTLLKRGDPQVTGMKYELAITFISCKNINLELFLYI